MESKQLAIALARALDAKKALDVRVLHVEDLTTVTDYFVIASGTSTTHVRSLADEVEFKLKQEGVTPLSIEGYDSSSWVLTDYGTVVLHVFLEDARGFYALERLWGDAPRVELDFNK